MKDKKDPVAEPGNRLLSDKQLWATITGLEVKRADLSLASSLYPCVFKQSCNLLPKEKHKSDTNIGSDGFLVYSWIIVEADSGSVGQNQSYLKRTNLKSQRKYLRNSKQVFRRWLHKKICKM